MKRLKKEGLVKEEPTSYPKIWMKLKEIFIWIIVIVFFPCLLCVEKHEELSDKIKQKIERMKGKYE